MAASRVSAIGTRKTARPHLTPRPSHRKKLVLHLGRLSPLGVVEEKAPLNPAEQSSQEQLPSHQGWQWADGTLCKNKGAVKQHSPMNVSN